MKSAGKEMAVGGAGLRGGWAAARGRRSEAGRGWGSDCDRRHGGCGDV